MSKKTLKDGLESLFGMPPASVEEETAFMGDNVLPEGKGKKSKKPHRKKLLVIEADLVGLAKVLRLIWNPYSRRSLKNL